MGRAKSLSDAEVGAQLFSYIGRSEPTGAVIDFNWVHGELGQVGVTPLAEKLFLDYSSKTPCSFDPETGEVTEIELFVGVLGASN